MKNLKEILHKIRTIGIILVSVCCLCFGCKDGIFEESISILQTGWNKDSLAHFQVSVDEVNIPYEICFNIEHSSDYPKRNLWLYVTTQSPDGIAQKDTVELLLGDKNGFWFGSGFMGNWSYEAVFRQGVYFPKAGKYTFLIQQGMRYDNLQGIESIGLIIRKLHQGEKSLDNKK